jgi:hypothetical protein
MNIKVKFVNEAKDGKKFGSIVGSDDTRYPCPKDMVSKFVKGQSYDIETKAEKWGENDVQVIKGIKTNGATGGTSGHVGGSGDKWWMPFVSNTVAHAIQAGHIKGPGEIRTWAASAKLAAESLSGSYNPAKSMDDLEDDIPL